MAAFAAHQSVAAPTLGQSASISHECATAMYLSEAFRNFNEATAAEAAIPKAGKVRQQQLQQQWQARGMYGLPALNSLMQCQSHISWETMTPQTFGSFYMFVFFLCRDPGRRNMQMDIAESLWRLVLRGRFRLLDRWCDFLLKTSRQCVVTEDTWRQVLDFARTIHEDLSNYDPSSAWVVLLDDFVEMLRHQRPNSRASSADMDIAAGCAHSECGAACMVPVSPRCGSKRRAVDLDTVTEQLSAMPFASLPLGTHQPEPHRVHSQLGGTFCSDQNHARGAALDTTASHSLQRSVSCADHTSATASPTAAAAAGRLADSLHGCSPATSAAVHLSSTAAGNTSTPKRLCGGLDQGPAHGGFHSLMQYASDVDILSGLSAVAVHLPQATGTCTHAMQMQAMSGGSLSGRSLSNGLGSVTGGGLGGGMAGMETTSAPGSAGTTSCGGGGGFGGMGAGGGGTSSSMSARRILKMKRGTGMNELLKAAVSDALFGE